MRNMECKVRSRGKEAGTRVLPQVDSGLWEKGQ